jgi:cytochrome oxidase Cu insertion factor (SCO1/SenC/PrrC family)
MIRRLGTVLTLAALVVSGAELPRKAPEFTINLNGGKKLHVSDYRGKGVVLAFILTTCSHCQATTGLLTRLQGEYGSRGLQVLESAIDPGAEPLVPGFIQQFRPAFPVGFNDFQAAVAFMQHSPMKIMHMPGLVFIDRQGNIVGQYEGSDPEMADGVQEKNLRAQIETILKPAAGSPAGKSGSTKKAAPAKK